jgi:hypothetical protein
VTEKSRLSKFLVGRRLDDPLTYLVLVGSAYVAFELVCFSIRRAASWDEAVYLSQVTPGMHELPFVASRSRGITLLVWPVLQFGGTLPVVRLFLAVLSAAALAGAFVPWVSVISFGAPIAAAISCSTWVALFYGSEVMPNLWVALLAVASVGLVGRLMIHREQPWDLPLASLLLALMGMFRPPDVIPIVIAMIAAGIWAGAMSVRRMALLLAGAIAGWVPWILEMSYRFGGPLQALDKGGTTAHVSTASLASRLIQHLAVSDGPLIGPVVDPHVSFAGIAWWATLSLLAIGGVVGARRSPLLQPLCAALLAGIGVAVEYLIFVNSVAPRFLLPTWTLLSIPAAWALCTLYASVRKHWARVMLVATLVVAWIATQVHTANRIEAQVEVSRGAFEDVGMSLRRLAGDRFCSFASVDGFPQIAFASGCDGRRFIEQSQRSVQVLERRMAPGHLAFVITHSALGPETSSTRACLVLTLELPPNSYWLIHELDPRGRQGCAAKGNGT